jgi:hypothetical protein
MAPTSRQIGVPAGQLEDLGSHNAVTREYAEEKVGIEPAPSRTSPSMRGGIKITDRQLSDVPVTPAPCQGGGFAGAGETTSRRRKWMSPRPVAGDQ